MKIKFVYSSFRLIAATLLGGILFTGCLFDDTPVEVFISDPAITSIAVGQMAYAGNGGELGTINADGTSPRLITGVGTDPKSDLSFRGTGDQLAFIDDTGILTVKNLFTNNLTTYPEYAGVKSPGYRDGFLYFLIPAQSASTPNLDTFFSLDQSLIVPQFTYNPTSGDINDVRVKYVAISTFDHVCYIWEDLGTGAHHLELILSGGTTTSYSPGPGIELFKPKWSLTDQKLLFADENGLFIWEDITGGIGTINLVQSTTPGDEIMHYSFNPLTTEYSYFSQGNAKQINIVNLVDINLNRAIVPPVSVLSDLDWK